MRKRKPGDMLYPMGSCGMPIGSPSFPDSTFRSYGNSNDSVSYGSNEISDDLGISLIEIPNRMKS